MGKSEKFVLYKVRRTTEMREKWLNCGEKIKRQTYQHMTDKENIYRHIHYSVNMKTTRKASMWKVSWQKLVVNKRTEGLQVFKNLQEEILRLLRQIQHPHTTDQSVGVCFSQTIKEYNLLQLVETDVSSPTMFQSVVECSQLQWHIVIVKAPFTKE